MGQAPSPKGAAVSAPSSSSSASSSASVVPAERLEPRVEQREGGYLVLMEKYRTSLNPQEKVSYRAEAPCGVEGGDEEVKRVTKGTDVHVKINLDGTGVANSSTRIPFLDHMLDQLASHGLFDVYVKATGDTHIDDHHSNEDIALAIGTALLQALGDRKGINRFAHFTAPLDEAAVEVILVCRTIFCT
ncbi:hypothetical protein ZWY2020_044098 [Hordeum vulgare]|nr:hypothetical protein ZWY2020_044098 [Hordeum vulgare]